MARPKFRFEGIPRFNINERVIWKSGEHWKSGEVLCFGKNKEEALKELPKGYKLQYSDKNNKKSKTKALIYLVAADSPLFKPGFTVHSIPERHLQKEKESWVWKEEKILEGRKDTSKSNKLADLALEVAKSLHKNKKSVPVNIKQKFREIYPELF